MYNNQGVRRRSNFGLFFIFLIFGLYFFNLSMKFFPIPATLASNAMYNQIIYFIAGVLIIVGGFKFLFPKRY
jgi:hypothetical protein